MGDVFAFGEMVTTTVVGLWREDEFSKAESNNLP